MCLTSRATFPPAGLRLHPLLNMQYRRCRRRSSCLFPFPLALPIRPTRTMTPRRSPLHCTRVTVERAKNFFFRAARREKYDTTICSRYFFQWSLNPTRTSRKERSSELDRRTRSNRCNTARSTLRLFSIDSALFIFFLVCLYGTYPSARIVYFYSVR